MKYDWISGLKGEEKELMETSVKGSKHTLDRLIVMLELDVVNLHKKMSDQFESPSWAMTQAHLMGQVKSLRKTIELLKI